MLRLLDIKSGNRKVVGIHGLGGIGKTTIARVVYNKVLSQFEGCTFIENVRENAEKYGIHYLQNQLIKDILKEENPDITDVDVGIKVIQQKFCKKKVLVVLDDVNQDIQAKSLIGDREWFGIGSKIIITTINKDILIAQKTDVIYEPNVMTMDDSLKLFSHYAFRRDRPQEEYLDLSEAITKTTKGLPLTLQVVGSSLFKKEKSVWKGMLKKLKTIPNNDVMRSLKISYDGLEDAHQQMFLDTACFFIGMDKDIAYHIWEGCGFSPQVGLDVLCVKSLVTITEDGKLRMHDMLQDLGRDIVHQESIKNPGERSRIWSQEEISEVLVKHMGTSNCEGLTTDFSRLIIDFSSRSKSQCLMSEAFAAMTELRLLKVDYAQFSGSFTNSFSKLRWLSWRGCPDQYALTNFCPQKLAVLDLSYSEITDNWIIWNCIKMAINLKVLSLPSCHQLSSIPDVSANQLLEVLILKDCEKLVQIDTSIGYLRNLITLDMSGCWRLEHLPIEICQLTSLETLNLRRCNNLDKLPDDLACMTSLTTLDVSQCSKLKLLPNLPSTLKSFHASDCVSFISIPMLSSLENLEKLHLRGCKKLVDISGLPSGLTNLDFSNCISIRDISSLPSSLTSLDVRFCTSIRDFSGLPSSLTSLDVSHSYIRDISGLPSGLTKLVMSHCASIRDISGLPSRLTSLDVSHCSIQDISGLPSSLTNLDVSHSYIRDISGLPSGLTNLNVSHCSFIRDISGLPSSLTSLDISYCSIQDISTFPPSLTSLDARNCSSIRYMSGLPSSLTNLDVSHCSSIQDISGLLSSLTYLHAEHCISLVKLSSASRGFRNLKTLCLDSCRSLEEIEGANEKLDSLVVFNIDWCGSLKKLPKLRGSKNLMTLKLEWNDTISDFEGEGMDSLEVLEIKNCRSLRKIPNLQDSKRLRKLQIKNCRDLSEIERLEDYESLEKLSIHGAGSLKTLPDISTLKNLSYLGISGCYSMERLPDLSNLKKLWQLEIENCGRLSEIPGIDKLESLRILKIAQCKSIQRLQNLSNLRHLKELKANDCEKLTEIQADSGLESLELLDARGCISLEKLPDLTNSQNLLELNGVPWQPQTSTDNR
ncbi:disease resistance protein RUN1-like [Macadamia integrifolia]|uniref:disease resistance protein RUN1-like n=1 Tax=Macadamia integrifolia TaxID=60698 RepID=UPI001C52D0F2|nr:disease resistance protein RUN1-like [Macadamia integrifolia]